MTAAVVIPIRSFDAGKSRLGAKLDPARRADLLRAMAENVVAAAGTMPVAVVSNAREVRSWAATLGLTILDDPGTLNLAAAAGLGWAAAAGFGRVVVAHADLPLATDLAWVADFPGVTLVPDRRRDGTNVAAVPTAVTFSFAYGKGSFARHRAAAARLDLPVRIVEDAALGWDVDLPADLAWPRAAADPTAAARR